MNKSKIEWCSHTWNPVTGCLHGCPYCYARKVAHRFAPAYGGPDGGIHELKEPYIEGMGEPEHGIPVHYWREPYPYEFDPTFHRYRLDEPARASAHRDIFVCSMADLFGKWVPTEWIVQIIDACKAAPQHRYMFLTKNPARYLELDHLALLPHEDNFWYGSSVPSEDYMAMYPVPHVRKPFSISSPSGGGSEGINAFWSMEPLLGPVRMENSEGLPQWVIIGAETGSRKEKVTPRREWVDGITDFCDKNEIPIFYKGNLREIFPDLPASAFPWEA